MKSSVRDCQFIALQTVLRDEGSMSIAEQDKEIPFVVRRVYYIYNVPDTGRRGFHAHKGLYQMIIPVHGWFFVKLDDGLEKRFIRLFDPTKGLLIVPGIWRELSDFTNDAVCLVLASEKYNESDYIRNYTDFLKFKT